MQDTGVLNRDWRDSGSVPFYPAMTFTGTGLVLGRGTLLAAFAKNGRDKGDEAADEVFRDGHEARALSLLAAAYGRPIADSAVAEIGRAGRSWRSGQKMLARFHLALIALPRIDEWAAYHLFIAGKALEKSVSPRDLLKALGYPEAARDLAKYSPDQPRVPAGSGRESGRWAPGDGGGAPRQRIVRRVALGTSATASDADTEQSGIVPGGQYAQESPTPILTPKVLGDIVQKHGTGWTDPEKGRFIGQYATADGIRQLIMDAWNSATPADVAGTYKGRVIIAATSSWVVNGVEQPDYVGVSGDRTEIREPSGGMGTPSVPTNVWIVILDSNMNVITCYPINPLDVRNPHNLPDD